MFISNQSRWRTLRPFHQKSVSSGSWFTEALRGLRGSLYPTPDAVGTVAKPFEWFAGIRVAMGYHYTNGVDVALAVASGIPATFEDERFLVKL